jgi:hypothetical protein
VRPPFPPGGGFARPSDPLIATRFIAMPILPRILVTAALLAGFVPLFRARRAVRATTLRPARRWGLAAWLLWLGAWIGGPLTGRLPPGAGDQLWYAAAVVTAVPAVAVLGARRPGSRVWTWFVLVPLVLVFAWPALTVWQDLRPGVLQLETPMILAYVVVLVMGWGNYLGTAYTLPAALAGAAATVLIWSFHDVPLTTPAAQAQDATIRGWAAVLLAAASLTAAWIAGTRKTWRGLDGVWRDFGDRFGIVWAKRLMDRVNETAVNERWSARLEMHGFEWTKSSDPAEPTRTTERAEHTLRWLLRRFVDPSWIDERMAEGGGEAVRR